MSSALSLCRNFASSETSQPRLKLTALALREFPLLNCSVDGDNIIYKNYVNIGVAVAPVSYTHL